MKWVSGATGAGEIFSRIVYELESEEHVPTVLQENRQSETFLEIMSPLDWSLYQIDKNKPQELQKIALKFRTNIPYDSSYWIADGISIEETSLKITPWIHTIEVVLKKAGVEILKKKSVIQVKNE